MDEGDKLFPMKAILVRAVSGIVKVPVGGTKCEAGHVAFVVFEFVYGAAESPPPFHGSSVIEHRITEDDFIPMQLSYLPDHFGSPATSQSSFCGGN